MQIAMLYAQIVRDGMQRDGFVKCEIDGQWHGVNDLAAKWTVIFFEDMEIKFPHNPLCYSIDTLAAYLKNNTYWVVDPVGLLADINQEFYDDMPDPWCTFKEIIGQVPFDKEVVRCLVTGGRTINDET
jgi:hypothetical protein